MRRLLDLAWYRYLWWRLGSEGRFVYGLALLTVLALGGFFSMRALAGSPDARSYVPLATKVTTLVRVRENGRVVVKPETVQRTQTIRTPTGMRVLTRSVVRYRPVYRDKTVTIRGEPRTINQVVTDMVSETQTLNDTITAVRTATSPPETVTVTGPTQTVRETVTTTVPMFTVTVNFP